MKSGAFSPEKVESKKQEKFPGVYRPAPAEYSSVSKSVEMSTVSTGG